MHSYSENTDNQIADWTNVAFLFAVCTVNRWRSANKWEQLQEISPGFLADSAILRVGDLLVRIFFLQLPVGLRGTWFRENLGELKGLWVTEVETNRWKLKTRASISRHSINRQSTTSRTKQRRKDEDELTVHSLWSVGSFSSQWLTNRDKPEPRPEVLPVIGKQGMPVNFKNMHKYPCTLFN